MKKEAINTFNKGLVYDLNPLTTPNNVLTDCINSTFVTFNGDELSLQNDAGNATIPTLINSIPGEVKLSNGFFPLGIKEFGGVLYIVSGKLPDINANSIPKWIPDTQYNIGEIVYNDLSIKTFYTANKITTQPLPIESNQYWKVIGIEDDYNNTYGEVEFGSYPSPEASGQKSFIGNTIDYNDTTVYNTTASTLYKYTIINNEEFKSSRYVTFDSVLTSVGEVKGDDNVSNYIWDDTSSVVKYSPKFYKFKLYHQLSNGYLDLTPDIWNRYTTKLGSNLNIANQNSNTWFKDSSFIYYCYSRFKGKLALSLEIENLYKFKLFNSPGIGLNVDNSYNLNLSILALPFNQSDTTLNITPKTITIPKVKIDIWVDETKVIDGIEILTGNNIAIYNTLSLPPENKNKLLKYQVTPILGNDGLEYNKFSLPIEFISKYTINGVMLINTIYDNITFKPVTTNVTGCIDGLKTFNEYILVNSNNDPINPINFEVSEIMYVFLKDTLTIPTASPTAIVLEYYGIDIITKKPTITPINGTSDIIISLFEQTTVMEICDTVVTITLNFNKSLGITDNISIYQYGYPVVIKNIVGNTTTIDVVSGVGVNIVASKSGYTDVTQSGTFLINGTLQFDFIDTVMYWKLIKCDGTVCYITNDTKITLQSQGMTFSSGDRFYGLIEGDKNYLYTFTNQMFNLSSTPSCVAIGLTKTSDTCS